MGYRHTKEEILEAALAAAFDEGLSRLTFGRLARRLGISDRVVVYYFPSKDDLIGEVLGSLGLRLQATLAPTLSTPVDGHAALVRAMWPLLARPEVDPVFALFFEAGGLAAAGVEPYATLVPILMAGWIDWAASFVRGTAAHRRSEASAAIAVLDGLLLVRQLAGAAVADRAARALGAR
jgi:AcrR family transcriptional regulator